MNILSSVAMALWLAVPASPQTAQISIRSSTWLLIEWNGRPPALSRRPSLEFDRTDRFYGVAACNRFSGTYSWIGWIITLKPDAWIEATCKPALVDLDCKFDVDLRRVVRLDFDKDGTLVARDASDTVVFRFHRAARNEID